MSVQLLRHRFTVDDYHEMARAGVLGEDDRVELVEGEIVDMTPIGSRHAASVNVLTRHFAIGCGTRAIVQPQGPLRLGSGTELQPDLLVLKPDPDFYRAAPPGPSAVFLLIEVGDTSITYDRTIKLQLYARAGIPEAWLVDLSLGRIELYREPTADGYAVELVRHRGERVASLAFPGIEVDAAEVIG
jgi:Uma2 family endonuclease